MEFGSIRFGAQIASAAATHHLDPRLLAAVAAQETGGPGATSGNNIVGDAGHGHGIFQIDDRSWGFAKTAAAMDPARNADFAASILSTNLQRYGGNVKAALSAYNAGSPTASGTATTWGDGKTLDYADSVLRHYDELGSATTAEQLASETGENVASVNALANAYGTTSPTAFAPSAAAASPFGTPRTWTQLGSASQQSGASMTTTMTDLIDEGDVFSSSDASDEA